MFILYFNFPCYFCTNEQNMFRCFICEFSCLQNKDLVLHVELSHKSSSTFQCRETDYSTMYCIFDSYKKHRLRKHDSESVTARDDSNYVQLEEATTAADYSDALNNDILNSPLQADYDSSFDDSDLIYDETSSFLEASNESSSLNYINFPTYREEEPMK